MLILAHLASLIIIFVGQLGRVHDERTTNITIVIEDVIGKISADNEMFLDDNSLLIPCN